MSDIFKKTEYEMITKDGRSVISITSDKGFKKHDLTIMFDGFPSFAGAMELNNNTAMTYNRLEDFEKMHPGLFDYIVKNVKVD